MDVSFLPALNATLNTTSAIFLSVGFAAIRRKNIPLHTRCMIGAFASSSLFLISYLTYHALVGSKRFPETNPLRSLYLGILMTHTVLAAAIVPLVLRTLFLAWKKRFEDHRNLARWTWPVWMYVSITGVIIYWMLYHLV